MTSIRASELGLNFDHWCFACGRANPTGLHLDLSFAPDRAEARFTGRREHEGYDGMLHGGVIAALLDEVMGWAIFHQGIWAVTTRLALRLRKPVPIGEEIIVLGQLARDRGRALELRGELRRAADDALLSSAEATYVRMSEAQRQVLIDRYGDPTPALARIAAATKRGTA